MFRRSRFSVRPNVGAAGRASASSSSSSAAAAASSSSAAAASSQEAAPGNQDASEAPKDACESSTAAVATVTPSDKPPASCDVSDQNGESSSSSAAVQRRKRFSIKPKVAPGRPSAAARTPKSPAKASSEAAASGPGGEPATSSQTGPTVAPQGLQSPRRRRTSEDSKQPKVQPKPTSVSSDGSGPAAAPSAADSLKQTRESAEDGGGKRSEGTSDGPVKEAPPRPPEKVHPSIPEKEVIEISEKAKTLLSSKREPSGSLPKFSLSRLLNDPSDLHRLAKARKLRELLKQELHKEKKLKAKARAKEYTLDPAKMTMRDLIRYLPMSNPMTSSLEDAAHENETVIPSSPGREESPERAQEPQVLPKMASQTEPEGGEEEEAAAEEAEQEEQEEDALMVPQVKVAEDGSLIIDEESLTVEVQRAKGPNPAQDRDPIFERGSTTTYSSFRKGTYSKPWSSEETDMFFLAISMVGTDFSMICQLFPHRARSEIKNKFKKEERENTWRIDKAFKDRRKLDIEYFSKLLQKILEVQSNRKKLKSLSDKNSPKKRKRKAKGAKGKKAARKLSDVEEEDEEEENELPEFEEEGEKENEELCSEGGTSVSQPKRKRKRRSREDPTPEEHGGEKSSEQDEACIPEDMEAALPEDGADSDLRPESAETTDAAKDAAIKPAKPSRGRAAKPPVPLGRKWAKKASDKVDESDGASKEQENKEASPSRQASGRKSPSDSVSSEDEDYTVQPSRPTRYGRVPKPTKPLNFPAKEEAPSSASETAGAASPAPPAAKSKPKKRGKSSKMQPAKESKKPKLVTLRASQSEYSDEEDELQREEEEQEEDAAEQWPGGSSSRDSSAPAFVPASLRSPHPGITDVEETMEELDILANMPDVLGISQDALCPDASCEGAQNETGTAEPCEHQLDLLVDVIDFLSSEHTDESEVESYNEAAQTLLTIGNMAHLSQSAQSQSSTQDCTTGVTSASVNESSQHMEKEIEATALAQEENGAYKSSGSGLGVTETLVEPPNSTSDKEPSSQTGDLHIHQSSDQICSEEKTVSTPQLQPSSEMSKTNSPQSSRGCSAEVEPTPTLNPASSTTQSESQPATSAVRAAEESQATGTASREPPSKLEECRPASVKDDISSEKQSCSYSGAQFGSSLDQASGDTGSTPEYKVESGCNSLGTSDTTVAASQAEGGSNTGSVGVHGSGDHTAAFVKPSEESPGCQKEDSKILSTNQTKRGRLQKAKPNLAQTPRTQRSKSKTTEELVEKDTNQPSNLECSDKAVAEKSQPASAFSPSPALVSTPCLDLGSTQTPTEELSSTKGKDVGLADQVESGAAAVDTGAATGAISESMGRNPTSQSSCNNLVTSEAVTESHVGPGVSIEPSPVQDCSNDPETTPVEELPVSRKEENQSRRSQFQKVKPKPNLHQTSRAARSKLPTTGDPDQKSSGSTAAETESKPTCSTTPPKQCESTDTASSVTLSLELNPIPNPTEELALIGEKKRDAGLQLDSSSESSEQSAAQQRRRLTKAKPNLGSSARKMQSKSQPKDIKTSSQGQFHTGSSNETSEPQPAGSKSAQTGLEPAETIKKHLISTQFEKSLSSRINEGGSTDDIGTAASPSAENPSLLTDPNPENESSEKPSTEEEPKRDSTPSGSEAEEESHTQQTGDLTVGSDVQCSEDPSAEPNVRSTFPASGQSTSSPEEHTQRPSLENVQQGSESRETNETVDKSQDSCTDGPQSEPDDPSKPPRKAPKTHRSRLIKPKPNLGRSSRPPQPQQVKSTAPADAGPADTGPADAGPADTADAGPADAGPANTADAGPADADSGTCSQGVRGSGSEHQPDTQAPVEGASEAADQAAPPSDAGTSSGHLTQEPEPSTQSQDAPASSAGWTQSYQSLSMFPDMLSVPSDPDEPFFILSLTEIPVCPSGEAAGGTSDPPPYLAGADAAVQPQRLQLNQRVIQEDTPPERLSGSIQPPSSASSSVSAQSPAAGGHDSLPGALVPEATEEKTGETDLVTAKEAEPDADGSASSIRENLGEPQGDLHIKLDSTRTNKMGGAVAGEEAEPVAVQANAPQNLQPAAPPVQPDASGQVLTERQTGSSGSGAPTPGARTASRKPRGFLSFLRETGSTSASKDPPRGKASLRGPKVTTPHSKRPPAATGASGAPPTTARGHAEEVAGPSHRAEEAGLQEAGLQEAGLQEAGLQEAGLQEAGLQEAGLQESSSASQVPQQSVERRPVEEEPTNVSQYFISDIFTDVEEG